jgi:SulP family sulfate permease
MDSKEDVTKENEERETTTVKSLPLSEMEKKKKDAITIDDEKKEGESEDDYDSDSDDSIAVVVEDVNHEAIQIAPLSPSTTCKKQEKRAAHVKRHVKFKTITKDPNDELATEVDDSDVLPPWTDFSYQVKWIVDGIAMGMLKYIFCIVAAIIIHDDKYTKGTYKEFIGIGIAVQCSSTLITCLITSFKSELKINISGPDIIAALFTVEWAQHISDGITKGVYAPNQAMPTLLMLIWVSTFGMGLVWYICGHLNVTEVIGIFPVPVQYGFLACIAWKVLKYGFKISMGYDNWLDPLRIGLVVLAFALGTALYFFKKWNHHLAVRILVFFMFVPIIGFLIVVLASGGNFNKDSVLREQYILFDYYEELAPWSLYVESYGNLTTGNIAWKALGDITILISMFSMWIVLLIDSLLKIAATSAELEFDGFSGNGSKEILLTGQMNIFAALAGIASPGYPQVKFNVLSYNIIENKKDKRVGYLVAIINGVLWLSGSSIWVLNRLPRFYFSFFLFYAAWPFLTKYVILPINGEHAKMKRNDVATILVIVLVVIILDAYPRAVPVPSMLVAVICGFIISIYNFVRSSVKVSTAGEGFSGRYFRSKVVRTYWEEALLTRVGNRVQILRLDGFIFFLTGHAIKQKVEEICDESDQRGIAEETRYLILDFLNVEQIDETGLKILRDIRRYIQSHNPHKIDLVLTGCDKFEDQFHKIGLLGDQEHHHAHHNGHPPPVVQCEPDLDHGMEHCENMILQRAAKLRAYWLLFESFQKLHKESQEKKKYQLFEIALGADIGTDIWKYAELVVKPKGSILCDEGEKNQTIFLLQRGRVTSFTATDDGDVKRIQTVTKGAVINDECIFLNLPVTHTVVVEEESTFWAITKKKLAQMEEKHPKLALAITHHILRYASSVRQRLERDINGLEHVTKAQKKESKGGKFHTQHSHGLAQKVMEKISKNHSDLLKKQFSIKQVLGDDEEHDHEHDLTLAQYDADHHVHNFKHINLDIAKTKAHQVKKILQAQDKHKDRPAWESTKPHLSKVQEAEARKWFNFHLEDERSEIYKNINIPHTVGDMHPVATKEQQDQTETRRDTIRLITCQKAIMDLGIFPTINEVRNMHTLLGKKVEILDKEGHHTGRFKQTITVDVNEFLLMIASLTLAELDHAAIISLHEMFEEFAEMHKGQPMLSKESLSKLMDRLQHHEDEIELNCIMNEWDVDHDHHLTFDAFVSIVSTHIKLEALDQELEKDFLRLCGLSHEEQSRLTSAEFELLAITKQELVNGIKEYGGQRGIGIGWKPKFTEDIATEMIYDADIDMVDNRVTFDELITCLEMIGPHELEEELQKSGDNSLWRAPSGKHLSFTALENDDDFSDV